MLNLKMTAIIGAVTLTILGGFYWYFDYSQSKIEKLSSDVSTYKASAESNEYALNEVVKFNDIQQAQIKSLQYNLKNAEKYTDSLRKKLRKHNLTRLSIAKPKMIENRMNEATIKVFKELEELTVYKGDLK